MRYNFVDTDDGSVGCIFDALDCVLRECLVGLYADKKIADRRSPIIFAPAWTNRKRMTKKDEQETIMNETNYTLPSLAG